MPVPTNPNGRESYGILDGKWVTFRAKGTTGRRLIRKPGDEGYVDSFETIPVVDSPISTTRTLKYGASSPMSLQQRRLNAVSGLRSTHRFLKSSRLRVSHNPSYEQSLRRPQ